MQHDGFLNKFSLYRKLPFVVRDVIEFCIAYIVIVFSVGFVGSFLVGATLAIVLVIDHLFGFVWRFAASIF